MSENIVNIKNDNISKKVVVSVSGMHCASCAINVEKAIKKLNGVTSAVVNIATEKAYLDLNPNLVTEQDIISAIEDAGYG
ncbi:TPA: heavy-metal-associated domain-containing protein, partial [Candidatus Poribacteria bacterium]|nr:heavy-metal-associated domain-containing protein [Candidatus Poribacteria bacterium]